MKICRLSAFAVLLSLSFTSAYALPIDWRGAFGVDTTLLNSFRKVEATEVNSTGAGTQEVPLASGSHAKASFQTYLFRLNPVMVVNDSATIKGEITSGYGRGGRLGDSGTESKEGNWGNSLYYYNTSNDSSTNLLLTKLYAELYSDTATYVVGRQSTHWGMGILYNSGEGLWDRHTYVRDGITMKAKLSNFHAAPYYAILNSGNSLTRATKSTEYGTTLLYDNPERDLTFGLVYAKRENDANVTNVKTDITNTGTAHPFGKTDVKITDIYLKKIWGRFTITGELAMLNGDIGYLYSGPLTVNYKAKALIGETSYKFNDSWKMIINAGSISGDSGARSSFQAMFLNPNYQIANILFRYNLAAVADPANKNIFDSYITNARFLKAQATLMGEKWEWNWALIHAVANETAKTGESAYNHSTNKIFNATKNQSDKLGTEFDVNATYHWNTDIEVGGSFGYLFTGDYWAFTNDASKPNAKKNSWLLQAKTGILF